MQEKMMKLLLETEDDEYKFYSDFWCSPNILLPIFRGYHASNQWKIIRVQNGFKVRPRLSLFNTPIPIGTKKNGMQKSMPFWRLKRSKLGAAARESSTAMMKRKSPTVKFGGKKLNFYSTFLKNIDGKNLSQMFKHVYLNLLKKTFQTYPSPFQLDVCTYIYLSRYLHK